MTTLRRLIHGRVDPADHRQLQQEAAARGISMIACVGECLREYFALRVEMASVVETPGKPGERHTGLIHSILARTEERLATTLDARATELRDELRRIRVMVDYVAYLYLVYTPDVPTDQRDARLASGTRRHASYRKAVAKALAESDPNAGAVSGKE